MNINYDEYIKEAYNAKINNIVSEIKSSNMAKRDKLKRIYEFLVDNCDIDDLYLSPEYRDGDLTKPIPYSYGIISRDSYAIHAGNKYGPVLCGKGVCRGFY